MSLSIPKTCRTDTFMSGRPAISCTAAVIDPPWLRNAEAADFGPTHTVRLMAGSNLAEAKAAKNPPRRNGTINYFNKIGAIHPVRKAGLGCPGAITSRSAESHRFQIIVGLDDLYQPIFRGAVTAIGIWVVAFHEFLE